MTDVRVAMGTTYRKRGKVRSQRTAFTIIELVVSLGILSILLVMAGSIFTLTLKSSGEATALIEVKERAAAIEQSLREDLRYVTPGNSLMVIQGNPVNAFLTADEQEADPDGDPFTDVSVKRDPQREFVDMSTGVPILRRERPRADILMFFTNRPGKSYVNPSITGRLQQVVYGHAELGEWNNLGIWRTAPVPFLPQEMPDPINGNLPTLRHSPAHDWVLARRSILIVDQDLAPTDDPPHYPASSLDDSLAANGGNDDEPQYSGLARAGWVRDSRRDYVVNAKNPVGNSTQDFSFEEYVLRMTPSPQDDVSPLVPSAYPSFPGNVGQSPEDLEHWIVPWFARSQLDDTPPPQQLNRLGGYFVPQCAGFKVEWALDGRDNPAIADAFKLIIEANGAIFWIDPGDMLATRKRLTEWINKVDLALRVGTLKPQFQRLEQDFPLDANLGRFGRLFVGSNHIFYARDPENGASYAPDPWFPEALRITVDLYDSAGRLDRPVRHVMVLPVGSD